jgi:hypothetical protein
LPHLTHSHYRLTGPVIQIVVGLDNASERETWCLPKALISHHSSFLKAACSQPFKEKEENCIFLPEDNAKVFGFFVQWMYYAKYEEPNPTLFSSSIHAKACVLGDKFISKVFKNYAMGRLYAAHVSLQLLMGPADMVYMLENTIPHSELFRFYLDFLATNLGSDVVVGTKMDWDEVVLDYEEVRIAMLQVLMAGPTRLDFVRPLESYLDKESTSTDN